MNKGVRWTDVLVVAGAGALLGCRAQENLTSEVQFERTGSSVGMIVDFTTNSATVFNADTDTILGTVPSGDALGGGQDCSITRRGPKGFFVHFDSTITVVDLTTTPPTLAGAPNPIPIDNEGIDTAPSPNGKFLLVCGGGPETISVIDVARQTQIGTFNTGSECTSVDVCSDGSVLITSASDSNVRRLRLSESGVLTDTGESMLVPEFPDNVSCSPMAKTGIVMAEDGSAISFKIPGLTRVSTRNLGSRVFSGAINHAGNRAYFRTLNSIVSSFAFDQRQGIFGAAPLFQVPVSFFRTPPFGVDQLAVHPSDASIYVSEPGGARILDARTGATIGSITSPSLSSARGVCFGAVSEDDDPGDDDSPGHE
jgi:WD40 repeat protein